MSETTPPWLRRERPPVHQCHHHVELPQLGRQSSSVISFSMACRAPRSTQKDVAIDGNYDPELRWHQLLDVFTCTCPLSARTMGFVIRMCGAKASEDCGKCCGSAPGNANPASATITGFASTINQSISRDHASHLPSQFKCTSGWVQNPT